jgi:EAL and modified HD-GYP domain-containing signal transduction protein
VPSQEKNILLAKQPIYKADHSLFGFELLFRSTDNITAMQAGEDLATSKVLINYCSNTTDTDKNKHPIFINVTESFLMSEAFLPIDKGAVVIELLERITVTNEFVTAVKAWRQKGYQFALDDFDFTEQWEPVLPYVSFIKVDVLDTDMSRVKINKASLSHLKVTWLAERIEHQQMLNTCIDLGFELFQGYYLAKPKAVLGKTINPSTAITTEIINKCNIKEATIKEISMLVTQDPKLSIQLLKLINSSMFTLPRPINDLKEAITFLGIDTLKKWALIIAFISDAKSPIETCRIVLTRAKACEFYARHVNANSDQADSAFLAGLLSGVDLLLELEPKALISQMNLSATIRSAIIDNSGELGKLISRIKRLEFYLSQSSEKISTLDPAIVNAFSLAQDWAEMVISALQSP